MLKEENIFITCRTKKKHFLKRNPRTVRKKLDQKINKQK